MPDIRACIVQIFSPSHRVPTFDAVIQGAAPSGRLRQVEAQATPGLQVTTAGETLVTCLAGQHERLQYKNEAMTLGAFKATCRAARHGDEMAVKTSGGSGGRS